jgi:hypothetical protein
MSFKRVHNRPGVGGLPLVAQSGHVVIVTG